MTNFENIGRSVDTKMGAVVKSPTSLFVWWDPPTNDRIMEEDNSAVAWALCLSEEGKSVKRKIPVNGTDNSYYLDVEPGKKYWVKLGKVKGGTFHAERGPVEAQTPSQSPHANDDPEWVDVRTGQLTPRSNHAPRNGSAEDERCAGLDWDEELLGNGASAPLSSSEEPEGTDGDSGDAESA